jgi:signal transduction histidine kinase
VRFTTSRRRWALIWLISFAALAAAAPAIAWWSSREPGVAGRAQALADAEALESALGARGRSWRSEVLSAAELGARGDPSALTLVRWDEHARLLAPRALPAGRELVNQQAGDPLEAFTPAQGWLAQARQGGGGSGTEAGVAAAAVAQACAEGLAASEPGEHATRARLRLLAGQAASRLGDWGAAAVHYAALQEENDAYALLDGRPLALLAAHRLADALESAGDVTAAQLTREALRQRLVRGEIPVDPVDLARELRFLREALTTGESDLAAEERAATLLFTWASALQLALAEDPARESAALGGGMRALLDPRARRGAVFEEAALRAGLQRAWAEVLPADGAWQVAEPEEVARSGRTLGAVVAPAGLPGGWRLVLAQPDAYTDAIARRQQGQRVGSWVLAAAFLCVGFFGQRALLRQAELERLRVEFISGVSHELRTPAASLALLAENLAEGRVTDATRQREYYEALRRDARRLQRLVADVLDVSRLERGSFRIEPVVQDGGPLLRRAAEEHHARLADAGLELRVELAEPLPPAPLDADVLERSLANLLENARKYAAAGKVAVLRARGAGGRLVIEVEDRGPGVPVEWRERVFEPFERVPDGAPLSAGAGLGLALVRAAAEAHGGSVRVESGAAGVGARFVLEFPLAGEPA